MLKSHICIKNTPIMKLARPKKQLTINTAKQLHAQLIKTQKHNDPNSITPILSTYTKSPYLIHKAQVVFTQINKPILLNYNQILSGLLKCQKPNEAIKFYIDFMHLKGVFGDDFTFVYIIKACGILKTLPFGYVVYGEIFKRGFDSYLHVSNALVRMFGSVGEFVLARKVFSEMPERDLVSWNSLICGYGEWNRVDDVLSLFNVMREENVVGDSVTLVKVLIACIKLRNWGLADLVVRYIEENHVLVDVYLANTLIDMYTSRSLINLARSVFDVTRERNIVTWNSMISGYMKAGDLVSARALFNEMPTRNVVSWTAMMTGYTECQLYSDAIKLFEEMMEVGVRPDEVAIASVLSSCAQLGSLDFGRAVHDYIRGHRVTTDIYVGNALIDMYCKCGAVQEALNVFLLIRDKDNISWSSIITGLAVNGQANQAIDFFEQMLSHGLKPTHSSFVGILLACAHAGLVDKGMAYFECMAEVYKLKPEMKHYGCVVDLLSRSGNVKNAFEFIKQMPVDANAVVWRIMLSACKLHGELELAEIATNTLLHLDPSNSGNYALLSNAYAGLGRWDDAANMRNYMAEGDISVPVALSSVEANG